MICKQCLQPKERIKSMRRRQMNRFYYVNAQGKLWNGHTCPDCKNYAKSGHRAESASKTTIEFDNDFIYC